MIMEYYLLALINFIFFLIRYRMVRRKKLLIIDPILIYHGIWAISFFIKGLNLVEFDTTLSSYLPLFILLWASLSIGLWMGAFMFRFRSHNQKDSTKKKLSTYDTRFFFLASTIINIVCLFLAGSIISQGYPTAAFFVSREYYNMAAEYKQLVVITFLAALQLVLYARYMPFFRKGRTFVIASMMMLFPGIIESAFTAGRTSIVTPIIMAVFIYANVKEIKTLSKKTLTLLFFIVFLVLLIFTLIDTTRTYGTLKFPGQEPSLMVIKYIQGPLDAFEVFNMYQYNDEGDRYPGAGTFDFFFRQLRKLGISYGIDDTEKSKDTLFPDPTLANYVTTMFPAFQSDYGNFFAPLILILFGMFSIYTVKKYYQRKNLFWLIFSSITNFQLLWSGQLYYTFGSSPFMFYLIWAYVLTVLYKVRI